MNGSEKNLGYCNRVAQNTKGGKTIMKEIYYIARNRFFKFLSKFKRFYLYDIDTDYHIMFFKEKYFGLINTNSYSVVYVDAIIRDFESFDGQEVLVIDEVLTSRNFIFKMRFISDYVHESRKYCVIVANIPKKYKAELERILHDGYLKIISKIDREEYDESANNIISAFIAFMDFYDN